MANKIKYGLKSVHYAVATIAADGSATYGTPVAIPGAVNLSMSQQGDNTNFYADNIIYWAGYANNGYEGTLELARIPESFEKDILGAYEDGKKMLVENAEAPSVHFALMFQFEGDEKATRHVLYNCTASRPDVASQTVEQSISPVTETLNISASSVYDATLDKNIVKAKTTAESDTTAYNAWFSAVYQPTAAV